jgi:hypothetical protein
LEAAGCPYKCELVGALKPLGESKKKLLTGQGFNMEVISMLTVFMLGNMVEREAGALLATPTTTTTTTTTV